MSSVPGKYIKDENGNIFSPIVSSDSVIAMGGEFNPFYYYVCVKKWLYFKCRCGLDKI